MQVYPWTNSSCNKCFMYLTMLQPVISSAKSLVSSQQQLICFCSSGKVVTSLMSTGNCLPCRSSIMTVMVHFIKLVDKNFNKSALKHLLRTYQERSVCFSLVLVFNCPAACKYGNQIEKYKYPTLYIQRICLLECSGLIKVEICLGI